MSDGRGGAAGITCSGDADAIARLPKIKTLDYNYSSSVQRWYQGTGVRATQTNSVTPYIYGRCAFADMAAAMATVTAPDHRIFLLDWLCEPDVAMLQSPPLALTEILSHAPGAIRAMFYDAPSLFGKINPDNHPASSFVNGLPNGAAIMDGKWPFAYLGSIPRSPGCHHQKMVIVSGAYGVIAFAGGMDLAKSRVDPPVSSEHPDQPWHDVHFRVTGAAAVELFKIFSQRWMDHPDAPALDKAKFNLDGPAVVADFARVQANASGKGELPSVTRSYGVAAPSNHAVAIGRTFGNLVKFRPPPPYSFARQGEETAWALVQQGVRTCAKILYIEDQYFVSRRLQNLLAAKLREPAFQFLLVLMQNSASFDEEFPYLPAARNEMRAAFTAIDPQRTKWRMFYLQGTDDPQRKLWCGSYVHSKMLLFDDEHAIIGSANADDRGYSYDSEIVGAITDDQIGRANGGHFARDLRIALWHKHLNVPHAQVARWGDGLKLWLNPPPTAMVVDASSLENDPILGANAILKNFPAADLHWRGVYDPDGDRLPAGF